MNTFRSNASNISLWRSRWSERRARRDINLGQTVQQFGGTPLREKFLDVSEKVLPKLTSSLAWYIGASVWKSQGNIRDVVSIGKLVQRSDGPLEIEQIVNTMAKYRWLERANSI